MCLSSAVMSRPQQPRGSVLLNLLMNGRDVDFGYELQTLAHDVSCRRDITTVKN